MKLADDISYYPESPPAFGYIMAKAANFLKLGPDQYRKADFFNMPRQELEMEGLKLIRLGFSQILAGRGYRADRPIQGIGVAANVGGNVRSSKVTFPRISDSNLYSR